MCLIGLWKLFPGAISVYPEISVENRSLPNATGNSGVPVPWTMAWTAIGSDGVDVRPLLGVAASDGVITKNVGELWTGPAVPVGEPAAAVPVAECVAVGPLGERGAAAEDVGARGEMVRVATGGAGGGTWLAWPTTSTATAINADRKLKISDPRARTTYFWRWR